MSCKLINKSLYLCSKTKRFPSIKKLPTKQYGRTCGISKKTGIQSTINGATRKTLLSAMIPRNIATTQQNPPATNHKSSWCLDTRQDEPLRGTGLLVMFYS